MRYVRLMTWNCAALLVLWLVAMGSSLAWNLRLQHTAMLEHSTIEARAACEMDRAYWTPIHGKASMTIEKSPQTPAQDQALDLPGHESRIASHPLVTVDATRLMRPIHKEIERGARLKIHRTGLVPLGNSVPDAWEVKALKAMVAGATEVSSVETLDGQPFLRLMRPLNCERLCTTCHTGSQVGDVQGGISVSVPLSAAFIASRKADTGIWCTHIGLILAGWTVIVLVTMRDQCKAARLRDSERRYRSLVQNVPSVNYTILDNGEATLDYISPLVEEWTGHSAEEFAAQPGLWEELLHEEDRQHAAARLPAQRQDVCDMTVEYRLQKPDGTWRWVRDSSACSRDKQNNIVRVDGVVSDITDEKNLELERSQLLTSLETANENLKDAQAQLLHDAYYDKLTGLANRALFMDRLAGAIARAKRNPDYLFAVLFIDLDRFKVVNDSLGHLAGDRMLVAISQRFWAQLRTTDTAARFGAEGCPLARLGGDEFTILLEDISDANSVIAVAERLQRAVSDPVDLGEHSAFTGASIGITVSSIGYDRPDQVLRDADVAMYCAKRNGGASHQMFNAGMLTQTTARLQMEGDLRRAIDLQEFLVYYQPILSLQPRRIAGFEALVRWQHPRRGLLDPSAFLGVAEETGLICEIGRWVLRTACRQLRSWQQQYPLVPPLWISVNLSPQELKQTDLTDYVQQSLRETDLDPRCLKIEITESGLVTSEDDSATVLTKLKELGVHLAIDDFGTGYSCFSYLHNLPFDGLKIDRSFVARMGTDPESAEIVDAITKLASGLNLEVIAEGVETQAQLDRLTASCEGDVQGYFISKPLDSSAAEKFLASERKSIASPIVPLLAGSPDPVTGAIPTPNPDSGLPSDCVEST